MTLLLNSLSTCRRDVWQWSCLLHSQTAPPASVELQWVPGPPLWPARLVAWNKGTTTVHTITCYNFNIHLGCSSMICSIANMFFPASWSRLCIQLVEAALKTGHQTRDLSWNQRNFLLGTTQFHDDDSHLEGIESPEVKFSPQLLRFATDFLE